MEWAGLARRTFYREPSDVVQSGNHIAITGQWQGAMENRPTKRQAVFHAQCARRSLPEARLLE
jgi:hypothetical protein